jgi:hypothetical protein
METPRSGQMVMRGVFILLSLLVATIIVESMLFASMNVPSVPGAMPRPVRRLFQQVYRHFRRSIVQFEPACSRYDPELTYTLRPGRCTFSNVEFTTEVRTNRLGLRDDDAALEGPQVIVLGDSYVMGWGVQQDETVARVVARKTGLKVLNAGISSYGTAREMRLLDRLDTSKLKTLVVQYSENDVEENLSFREHQGALPIMSEAEYNRTVQDYLRTQGYYPGKYVIGLFSKAFRLDVMESSRAHPGPVSSREEAEFFLNVLAHGSRARLDGVQIIVFEVNEQIRPPRSFIANVAVAGRGEGNPEFIRRLRPLDVAPLLEEGDFYHLDDHLRAHGHEVIGTAIANIIASP